MTRVTPLPEGPVHLLSATPGPDLLSRGYLETEYAVSGQAVRYLDETGATGETAPFTTRVLVRRPRDQAAASGVLVAEWFNVSSGDDAAPDYTYLAEEIVRRGHVWVGVSAQYVGTMGGSAILGGMAGEGNGLVHRDPGRYASLDHPGDAFCYRIFDACVAALTEPGGPLADLDVHARIAVGESQSAFALTTYLNVVHPQVRLFDGFLVHSRGGASMPLGEPGTGIDLELVRGGPATTIRDDLAVPVIIVQTETDLLSARLDYLPARQPDSERLRLWEVAGAAHADHWHIGDFESFLGCADLINRGQQCFVLRAALRALVRWVCDGLPAPAADRLAVATTRDRFETDDLGNVLGGVRTPCVDAATQVLTGLTAADVTPICGLFGRTLAAPVEVLQQRYPDPAGYRRDYEEATDRAIAAGFVLAEDRDAVLAESRPDLVPGA